MQIIKRGVRPANRVYRASCDGCNSVIQFVHSEATVHIDQRDGNYLTIKCPVCPAQISATVSNMLSLE